MLEMVHLFSPDTFNSNLNHLLTLFKAGLTWYMPAEEGQGAIRIYGNYDYSLVLLFCL